MTTAKPFKLAIADADIADLRHRLRSARWPVEVAPDTWERGIPGGYLRQLAERWVAFDWRAKEAELNRYDQVMLDFEGAQIHAFHIRSRHADAMPLVLCHGWPSSGIEYLKLVEPLTNPADPRDAFHLIIPTAPGFGLSPAPGQPGWTAGKTAAAIVELLNQFGYDRFAIHGTDMGSDVAAQLDVLTNGRAIGLHLGTDLDSVIAVASTSPSSRPAPRRSAMRSTIPRSASSPGSPKSSRPGPTPARRRSRRPSISTSSSPM